MTEPLVKNHNFEKIADPQKVMMAFAVICTLLILGWVLWVCNYGLDFTDESFYLVWIANPFNYSVSATQFGFIYHPLYKLLEGNIAGLRQVNILATFCLAWMFSYVFLKTVFRTEYLRRISRLVISATFAASALVSLVFAGSWLATPSYNSLALQALLIAGIGLLLAEKHASYISAVGWFLIGCGGWLAFMAKPTTAIALAFCTGAYLLFAGKLSLRLLATAVATAAGLIVLSALTIDGSIFRFFDRLNGGAEMYSILSGGKTAAKWFRLDILYLEKSSKDFFFGCFAVFFVAALFSQTKIKIIGYISTILSISFALTSVGIIFGFIPKSINLGPFQSLLLLSVPLAAILTGFLIYRVHGFFQISRHQWALAFAFLVFPYVYAFGSGNNYWKLIGNSGIFCVFSGLVLLGPIANTQKFPSLPLSLGLAVQLVTVMLVDVGIDAPYRQPHPLLDNNYKLEIGKPGSSLVLSSGFGQYFSEAVDLAKQAGFTEGTPVIDLTGQSPGILYAMGANNIGQVWTVGGYPGSEALAITMLRKVPCQELAIAWLLIEPEGPRRIASEIISSFGGNMDVDYKKIGTLTTARGAGGYSEPREQKLLKPVRAVEAAMASCTSGRIPK